ncbi:MAG: FAD:protein FMN transferase [Gammaproteobacteria bacterium]|nr:FAD:protein FMN transferase [Gammaproteobacteria bacterium]NIR28329.1 FAD:protein FMN transferase [Gammaproteobacteria bacterium]NIR96743.1 FAD:protein FMN transferase [Gammaproteobacteria bacterium]NIT62445.1 FAD:protein FMN transferase [Gammaproteobacteria bacterium]NIV19378.1 FAD:protein FMN transferase [Gammaproteobacteria bacterium]
MAGARSVAALGLATALAASCAPQQRVHSGRFLAFGTLVEVTIWGTDERRAHQAIHAVEQEFRFMHRTWHAWRPGALGRVNALLATTEWFSVPPSVRPLIVRGTELAETSRGLFNPAIGKLVELWGFHQDERPAEPPPEPGQIAELVEQAPRMTDLELEGIRLRSRNSAVQLDFGAFAKGYGVDRAIELLRQRGIDNAVINAGGDLRAIGRHGERPWRIGIRDPRGPGILASLEIEGDESVFTSGDYERYFDFEGVRYHHILDPRTGRPARGVTSVTVIHNQGAAADAAATALFVAGVGQWRDIARSMGIKFVMLVDASGHVHMNPAMAERIRFEGEETPPVTVTVTDPL